MTVEHLVNLLVDNAPGIMPVVGLLIVAVLKRRYGSIPDVWRLRRQYLPQLSKIERGQYNHAINLLLERLTVDELNNVRAKNVTNIIPEKTALPLQDSELVGVVAMPPRAVRQRFTETDGWMVAWLASIQYELDGDTKQDKTWEVGSYAHREDGILSTWQVHVRLTPRDNGMKTALWAHREKSPWTRPRDHYAGLGWNAQKGVDHVREFVRDDPVVWFDEEPAESGLPDKDESDAKP